MKKIDFSIVLYNDHTNRLTFFTGLDFLWLILWVILVLVIANYIRVRNKNKEHYKFFMLNLYFKLAFSLIFCLYFIFFIRGGDTIAYFDTSRVLTNLLFKHPEYYFAEWPAFMDQVDYVGHFSQETGFPPKWIAREEEGYFVSKIFSLLNIFTGSSYLANNVITAFLMSLASFRLYDFFVSFGLHDTKKLAIYFLFIPSIAFWCSGFSKDVIAITCLYYMIPTAYNFITIKKERKIWNIFLILLLSIILFKIRPFMLLVIFIPFLFLINFLFLKTYFKSKFTQRIIWLLFVFISLGIMQNYLTRGTGQKYLNEIKITQTDFKNNQIYTGAKYDIGDFNSTLSGLLKATPISLVSGIYRPLLWEALSPGLILNGIESVILIYLTAIFFMKKRSLKIERIQRSGILIFSFYFVMLFAYVAGYTSVIFGLLVRIRAPLLPIFIALITVKPEVGKIEEKAAPEVTI